MKTKFDVALIQKPLDEGLTRSELMDLADMIEDNSVIPIEIQGENASAMGFISADAAADMKYEYVSNTPFYHYIQAILNDKAWENENCEYHFGSAAYDGDFEIYLGYEERELEQDKEID